MTTYTASVSRTTGLEHIGTREEYPNAARATRSYHRTPRAAIIASSDTSLSLRLSRALEDLRWEVSLATGGADAMAHLDGSLDTGAGQARPVLASTLLVDSWLPDLEVRELVRELSELYPDLDVLAIDGTDLGAPTARGRYRHEVLLALRAAHASDEAAWTLAPSEESILSRVGRHTAAASQPAPSRRPAVAALDRVDGRPQEHQIPSRDQAPALGAGGALKSGGTTRTAVPPLAEFIGSSPTMLEVSRRIRLVAPRTTSVLIEGATGTGKELVARALHRLSPRAARSFVALNCAAIPEALLESELFGHTRGAFTGAAQARVGRIESAHGGTLFLDEIGELPLALQAKLLRFLECGELQRVGENEPVRVDVRIVAATHRGLTAMVRDGSFRADLFYRLSVFLIRTPSLSEHQADVPALVEHFLQKMGHAEPAKRLSPEALQTLLAHSWPGNVRELEHVLERAWILAEDRPVIGTDEIEFGEPMI